MSLMTPSIEGYRRRQERQRAREERERAAELRARMDRMIADRGRRERMADAEGRLAALRMERDAAVRRYRSRLRLELMQAEAALRAARGEVRLHPLAPYAQTSPGDPAAVEEAEVVVGMIRRALAEEQGEAATRPAP